MKPVAIFRHASAEGPGYFVTYLSRHGIPWRMVKIDENEPVPEDPGAFSGMALMGGPMSVNDDLPWIERVLALIRAAVTDHIPVLGHCLGGQLMAKAMGGQSHATESKKSAGVGSTCWKMRRPSAGSAPRLSPSRRSTGTAKRSRFHRARCESPPARTARTRCSCSIGTSRCNAMWK